MNKKTTVIVFEEDDWYAPTTFNETEMFLSQIYEKIPEQYRGKEIIQISPTNTGKSVRVFYYKEEM